jgi:hypothetical protein
MIFASASDIALLAAGDLEPRILNLAPAFGSLA